jgi:hypothetical protein
MQDKIASGLGYPWISSKTDPPPPDLTRGPVGWQKPPVSRETKTNHEEWPA